MRVCTQAGLIDRLASGKVVAVTLGEDNLVLFKAGSTIHVLEGWCLRCGSSLAEGRLQGRVIACRHCDWRYDVTTGSVLGLPALKLHTFVAKLIDGRTVVVDV